MRESGTFSAPNIGDGSIAIFGVARDVTARMATEQALRHGHERMRLLLEHATDVVF